jgi:cell wall assembly regulator SMI1
MITVQDIANLEANLRISLPESYRSFLLLHNGGIPTPDVVDVPGLPGSPTDVQVFFGIGRPVESSDLAWNAALAQERFDGGRVLPFACDSGGGLFCFKIDSNLATEVVYLDFYAASKTSYAVANSFQDFVAKMRSF